VKTLALFAIATTAACVSPPATSNDQNELAIGVNEPAGTQPPPDVTTAVQWTSKMTGADIWPADPSILSCHVVTRAGQPDANGNATFYAFVVWNADQVGAIFWIQDGADGTDFIDKELNVFAARNGANPTYRLASSDGNPLGGTSPAPHPNVTTFSERYLGLIKTYAADADRDTRAFLDDTNYGQ